ncbi:MAG: hypothetical protein KF784_01960 [Fimbriimonadaceae bacterium]|nr:hypothetical protein [Fimbriimonadaceae bacterium]
MWLKIATTISFVTGLLMLALWPWVVGAKPEGTGDELKRYALRYGYYLLAVLFVFVLTCALSLWLLRRQRAQFREEAKENLKELIEGTLKDHERKDA